MPRYYKKKASARKISRWYKKRRYQKKSTISRLPLTGFPKSKMVRLRYVDELSMNPNSGTTTHLNYAANALYDPYLGVGGHQPRGFDQWMTIYDHYTCVSSKCTLRWIPTEATAQVPGVFGLILNDDTIMDFSTIPQIIEGKQNRESFRYYGDSSFASKGKNPVITKTFSAKKMFGKKAIVGANEYKGSSSANPTELAVWQAWCGTLAGTDAPSQRFLIEIEYIAVFTEQKSLPES